MDDLIWGLMVLGTAAVACCFWGAGLLVKKAVRQKWVLEKFGKSYVGWANGLADLILSVPVLSVLIFFFAIIGGDDGLTGTPLVIAGLSYLVVCIGMVVGFVRWFKKIGLVWRENDNPTNDS